MSLTAHERSPPARASTLLPHVPSHVRRASSRASHVPLKGGRERYPEPHSFPVYPTTPATQSHMDTCPSMTPKTHILRRIYTDPEEQHTAPLSSTSLSRFPPRSPKTLNKAPIDPFQWRRPLVSSSRLSISVHRNARSSGASRRAGGKAPLPTPPQQGCTGEAT